MYKNEEFSVCTYTLHPDAPSEDIWEEAQAHGCWVKFSRGYNDVQIVIDSRLAYNTYFVLKYTDWIACTQYEIYIA
jgi:hypothetical protein